MEHTISPAFYIQLHRAKFSPLPSETSLWAYGNALAWQETTLEHAVSGTEILDLTLSSLHSAWGEAGGKEINCNGKPVETGGEETFETEKSRQV